MNLLKLLELLLGTAEQVVPAFIHNPASQKIEGLVIGTVNGLLLGFQTPTTTDATGTTITQTPSATTVVVGKS